MRVINIIIIIIMTIIIVIIIIIIIINSMKSDIVSDKRGWERVF